MYEEFQSLTIDNFRQRFSTAEQCIDYIASVKWAGGYSCKQCGHAKYCKGFAYGSRQCTRCNKVESAKVNTLFQNMKIPLDKAFYMLYLIVTDKKGSPSTQLARQTGLTQKTCLMFHRKVMAAMASTDRHPLEGNVDVVEVVVDIIRRDKDKKPKFKQARILVGIEKKGGGAARSYVSVIGHASKKRSQAFITRKIDGRAMINMDQPAQLCCYGQQTSGCEGLDKALDQRVVRNMLNWLYARHGYVTYLQDYLNEYCYRYNRHRMKGEILDDILSRMIGHKPRTWKMLIAR